MPIHLTNNQINRIEELLSNENEKTTEHFIIGLMLSLDRSFIFQDVIGNNPPREIKIKQEIQKIKETAELCYSLKYSLKNLDSYFFNSHDKSIISYVSEKTGVPYDRYSELSFTECLDGIIKGLISQFSILDDQYGRGYLDSLIMAVFHCWQEYFPSSISLYEKDNFVQLLTIILDTDSTDKVIKALRRSAMFSKYNKRLIQNGGNTLDLYTDFDDQEDKRRHSIVDKSSKDFFNLMSKKYKL